MQGINFFYGTGKDNHQWRLGFFVHHRIVSAGKSQNLLLIGCHI